jgi:hypothetical protein
VNLSKLLFAKANEEAGDNRVLRLPARKEQADDPLYAVVGSAAIVIAWTELFRQHCL